MLPIQFGTETIFVPEITYAEYEDFLDTFKSDDNYHWLKERLDLMARYAVRQDGSKRFVDRSEMTSLPAKSTLKAALAFYLAFRDLNLVTQEEIDEMQKN